MSSIQPGLDVGLVVALEEEFQVLLSTMGMRAELEDIPSPIGDTEHRPIRLYRLYSLDNSKLPSISLALAGDMGETDAIFATQHLIRHHRPALLVSAGISGGLSDDVRLGDIVIATEVDDYLHRSKAIDNPDGKDFDLALAGDQVPFSDFWIKAALSLQDIDRMAHSQWMESCEHYRAQSIVVSQLDNLLHGNLIRMSPTLHHGITACGPIVGASDSFVAFLLHHNRNYLSLDMESHGVGRAAQNAHIPALSIRGISDFSDNRKKQLERSSKGNLRKTAIQSVATFLRHFLHHYSRSRFTATAPGQFIVEWSRLLVDLQQMSSRYLTTRMRAVGAGNPRDHAFVRSDNRTNSTTAFFSACIDEITRELETAQKRANVVIRGPAGSGKSYLLRKIYNEQLAAYDINSGLPFPVYIDLKYYDAAMHSSEASAEAALQQFCEDIGALSESVHGLNGKTLLIIVDSIDHHAPHRDKLEDYLHRIIQSLVGASVLVAIGNDGRSEERLMLWTSGRPKTIELHPWPAGTSEANELIDLVVRDQSSWRPVAAQDVHQAIERLEIRDVDYLTVLKLVEKIGDSAFDRNRSISDFYQTICHEYIKIHIHHSSELGLAKIAECAHQEFIQLKPEQQKGEYAAATWKLLHYHSTVQDFLIAYHVIDVLRQIGKNDLSNLSHLNYVFPERIDKLCKGIMWHSDKIERECVEGAERLYGVFRKKRGKYMTAMTHASYLLGRVWNADLKHRARGKLTEWKVDAERKEALHGQNEANLSIGRRLLYLRTLYISLAYLGDTRTAEEYVNQLMSKRDWDDLNRGFHLEYYHDKPYLPDENQLAHEDNLEAFPKTFLALTHRIDKALVSGIGPSFPVEWYTLLSLAQHRHAADRLSGEINKALKELIERVADVPMSAPLREYTDMMANTLEIRYPVGRIMETLYKLKRMKRVGYTSRGKLDGESVADHTFGTMLLAELFLPEDGVDEKETPRGYDKQEILRMLLIHDLAEAFTGDRLPHEHSAEVEEGYFRYMEMAGTYRPLSGLQSVRERWEIFEKSGDINAKIARDIDKIENQLQLLIYINSEGWKLEDKDLETWERDLAESVKTPIGRAILQRIRESF